MAAARARFDVSAIIQTFREKPSQPRRLISRLAAAAPAVRVQILVNDDSGEQGDEWRRHLRPGDVYVQSPNVHEVLAYNRLAKMANASLLAFLQGDNCLPRSPRWLEEAVYLYMRHPRLAILGGHAGFDDPVRLDVGGFGPYPRRAPLPFYIRGPHLDKQGLVVHIAFAHVAGVNIGPYFVAQRAFRALGGFTSAYGARGEPGGHFDVDLCLRAWMDGRFTVGLYYAAVGNGIGGHKTRKGAQGRARRRNQLKATIDMRRRWREQNGTIGAFLNAENGQLLAASAQLASRLQFARRESTESCGGK
jgi:GT2 family glycosyltransferase